MVTMDQLPEGVKSLLQNHESDRPCCSFCGIQLHDAVLVVTCDACPFPRYCSIDCRGSHDADHAGYCGQLSRYYKALKISHSIIGRCCEKVPIGDDVIRMGFHADRNQNRKFYLREALKLYLEGMVRDAAFGNRRHYGAAEDRVLLLMIALGGDAQLLLDWLAFTSQDENDETEFDRPSPSSESEGKIRYPLLALHGLFELDDRCEETTFVNLYLLASCRSLVYHIRRQKSVEGYKAALEQGMDSGALSAKLGAVNRIVASFLWGPHEYDYGEALLDEIPRIMNHIRGKWGGTLFLRRALDESIHFVPLASPFLFTTGGALHLANLLFGQPDVQIPPMSSVPEFWFLYQESLLALKPELELSEVLVEKDSKPPGKAKKD